MSDIDREEEFTDGTDAWSVSKLQTIQACGQRYKRRYVDHEPEEKGIQLRFGSIIHYFLDLINKKKIEDIGELQERFVDSWKSSRTWDWTGEFMTPAQYKSRGLKMLRQYWEGHKDDVVIASEVKFEMPCVFPSSAHSIRGVIDKIQEIAPGVLAVVDFKTSKNPPDWTVLRRDLQLTTYYHAADWMGYKVNYLAIHHLLSGDIYWTWRDANDITAGDLGSTMMEAKQKVDLGMFARNIDYHCKWCSYRESCLGMG